jgi:hypothetical protein
MQTVYLLPLTVASLILAVAALGFRARRRGYGSLIVGVVGGGVLILGKFVLDSNIAVYGGLAGPDRSLAVEFLAEKRPCRSRRAALSNREHYQGDVKMATKRKIEVFSAGCPVCQETVKLIQRIACPSCDMSILDMNDPNVAQRAKSLGICSIPAVVINGKLADCCQGRGPDEATLRAAGLGVA